MRLMSRAKRTVGNPARRASARRAQVARNPHYPDDGAGMVAHRKFGRQAPAGPAMGVPMQFEMVNYRTPGAGHGLVLAGIKLGQLFGKDLAHLTTEKIMLVLAAAAFHQ